MNLLVLRISISGVIFLSGLIIAYFTSPEMFGAISLLVFVVKNISQFTLGINQGFIFSIYAGKKYDNTYTWMYLLFFLLYLSIVYYLYGVLTVAFSVCLFILILPEPYLKTKRNFLLVTYPELILMLSFGIALIGNSFLLEADLNTLALIACPVLVLLYFALIDDGGIKKFILSIGKPKIQVAHAVGLIKTGFPSYIFNFLFFAFLFVDRKFIAQHDEKILGVVMLAYQFSLAAGLIASVINSTAVVYIGENIQQSPKTLFKRVSRRLFYLVLTNIFLYLCVLAFVIILGPTLYPDYPDLVPYVALIGGGLLFFNAYGCVAPICFHLQRQSVQGAMILLCALTPFATHWGVGQNYLTVFGAEVINISVLGGAMFVATCYALLVALKYSRNVQ